MECIRIIICPLICVSISEIRNVIFVIVVDSNDSLYGSDKKFIAEISKIADTIINLLLEHLKQLSTTEEVR